MRVRPVVDTFSPARPSLITTKVWCGYCDRSLTSSLGGYASTGSGGVDPPVMLSPNARNVVALSLGGPVTRTVNLHVDVCCRRSMTEHSTVVVPSENAVPDAGAQVADSG